MEGPSDILSGVLDSDIASFRYSVHEAQLADVLQNQIKQFYDEYNVCLLRTLCYYFILSQQAKKRITVLLCAGNSLGRATACSL